VGCPPQAEKPEDLAASRRKEHKNDSELIARDFARSPGFGNNRGNDPSFIDQGAELQSDTSDGENPWVTPF
jgi:hypothetical protein